MSENNTQDHSISDLRAMLQADREPIAEVKEAVPAEVAQAATETDPASGTEDTQQQRGEDGKFKPTTDADLTPNAQKRIAKAVKAQREAERERDELRQQRAAQAEPAKPAPTPATEVATAARPEAKNFDSYEDYVEALAEFKLDQREAKREAARAQEAAQKHQAEVANTWNERVETLKARPGFDDFDDLIAAASALPISQAMHIAITESENGPELGYWLAKHPDEVARIAKLSPISAAKELGKIEAKFTAPAAETAPKKPLPKPAATVGGTASPKALSISDPEIDMATFKRLAKTALKG